MSKESFRCPVCDTTGQWTNIDHLRLKRKEMHICDGCGFVGYPTKYKSYEEIKSYYANEYRATPPQAANLFTGERKLQYHAFFLGPLFEEWKKAGIEKPVIGEVGAAYGMALNFIKTNYFPEAEIHGTELTKTYKSVAFHEYGIRLEDDFDETKKYDLIISYHVLEHQLDPDKWLARYAKCLKDSGVLYLSCPIWFREASNGGGSSRFGIEAYWATDHINCWSEEHLEWVIEKSGLKPIMKDTEVYGNTYILKKHSDPVQMPKWDSKAYTHKAEQLFKCWQLLEENKTDMAIEAYKNCPSAWVAHFEFNRKSFNDDKESMKKFFESAHEACPNSCEIPAFHADVLTRYEKYDEAMKEYGLALKRKPNNPKYLMGISNCWRMKAKKADTKEKKNEYLNKSINILRFVMSSSTELFPQALSWVYYDEASLDID